MPNILSLGDKKHLKNIPLELLEYMIVGDVCFDVDTGSLPACPLRLKGFQALCHLHARRHSQARFDGFQGPGRVFCVPLAVQDLCGLYVPRSLRCPMVMVCIPSSSAHRHPGQRLRRRVKQQSPAELEHGRSGNCMDA